MMVNRLFSGATNDFISSVNNVPNDNGVSFFRQTENTAQMATADRSPSNDNLPSLTELFQANSLDNNSIINLVEDVPLTSGPDANPVNGNSTDDILRTIPDSEKDAFARLAENIGLDKPFLEEKLNNFTPEERNNLIKALSEGDIDKISEILDLNPNQVNEVLGEMQNNLGSNYSTSELLLLLLAILGENGSSRQELADRNVNRVSDSSRNTVGKNERPMLNQVANDIQNVRNSDLSAPPEINEDGTATVDVDGFKINLRKDAAISDEQFEKVVQQVETLAQQSPRFKELIGEGKSNGYNEMAIDVTANDSSYSFGGNGHVTFNLNSIDVNNNAASMTLMAHEIAHAIGGYGHDGNMENMERDVSTDITGSQYAANLVQGGPS